MIRARSVTLVKERGRFFRIEPKYDESNGGIFPTIYLSKDEASEDVCSVSFLSL